MSRLVLASNRVADLSGDKTSGGLAVALSDAVRSYGGVWFGWSGEVVDNLAEINVKMEHHNGVILATQALTKVEYQSYYLNYANRVLWPVLHHRLDLADFATEALEAFSAMNRRFAQTLASLLRDDDIVWVHDFHLIPLAAELRNQGISNRIGFFLHTPFPPPKIVSALPNHDWLFDRLFAYDVVGFQTEDDLSNFRQYVHDTRTSVTSVTHPFRALQRNIIMKYYPIGIDVDSFRSLAFSKLADEEVGRLKRSSTDSFIGVDRLDYTKGQLDRFKSYQTFLREYPQHHKRSVFTQIITSPREEQPIHKNIRSELEGITKAINGEFGELSWMPVHCMNCQVSRAVLAAVFRASDVALVTPLRDGMNLVAKEYVAAQDTNDPGVLVLSQFAGAAADLREAIVVDPSNHREVALAMNTAITMKLEERKARQECLLSRIKLNDAKHWRQAFIHDLAGVA